MIDIQWLRDYGTFIAATLAFVAAIVNGALGASRERRIKSEDWLRQLRLPRYAELARAADAVEWALWNALGIHEHDWGPQPDYPSSGDAWRDFRRAKAEILIVGPPAVVEAVENVEFSLRFYGQALDRDPVAADPPALIDARTEFYVQAAAALGIEVERAAPPQRYLEWLAEHELER